MWEFDYSTFYNPDKGDSIKLIKEGKLVALIYDGDAANVILRALKDKGQKTKFVLHMG